MRTVASIGDRPLPVVTGEPGASVAADRAPPERHSHRDSEGEISGRVVDDQGEPVAGAEVRLAVNSAPGGRLLRTTTDRAGGFTLRGLRPGTSYTVIAEWEEADGVLTGRSNAEAPDDSVEIALAPAGAAPRGNDTSRRVDPVSSRAPFSRLRDRAEDEVAEVAGAPINVEDLPPAPEAETLAPARRRKAQAQVAPSSDPGVAEPTSGAGGWRPIERTPTAATGPDTHGDASPDPEPPLTRRRRAEVSAKESATDEDEDGSNPLPPALEPDQAFRPASDLDHGDDPFAEELAIPERQATALTWQEEPRPEAPPGALVAVPPSTGPVASASADNAGLLPPPIESSDSALSVVSESAMASPPPSPLPSQMRSRPRWRDLAASPAGPIPLEPSGAARTARESGASDPNATGLARGSPEEPDSYCHFDSKRHRIEDFRLPDLQGRLVRFQDFDSDLILLDFWGTWCQPCMRSVPHLVDLQRRMGGKQLQVVGIACEPSKASAGARTAAVAKATQKLGINYPVLVSSLDGTCPLQKALNVQAYPTLILVDRQGRILWQDKGATRLTLFRLDRMLEMAARSTDGQRRF
jgi:thiol-disulfide isomerase/thioredoxin